MYVYTHSQRALAAASRVLLVASNHDKGSFYIWLLEEVTDPGKCQEKSSHWLSRGCQHTDWGGNNLLMAQPMPISPESFPEGLASQAPSEIGSSGRQPAKRPRSQWLFAIGTASLPILLPHSECCRVAEAPPDQRLGLSPTCPDFSLRQEQHFQVRFQRSGQRTQETLSIHCRIRCPLCGATLSQAMAPPHPHHPTPQYLML